MYIESKDINSISWSAEIDLLADLEKLAEARLNEFGITRDISKEASVQFVSYSFREISSNPKMLFQSKEFTCPSGYENAFNTVCRKIAEGEDLSPFFHEDMMILHFQIIFLMIGIFIIFIYLISMTQMEKPEEVAIFFLRILILMQPILFKFILIVKVMFLQKLIC